MRSSHTNFQQLVRYRWRLIVLTFVSICLASISFAQSGRTRQSTVDPGTQTNQAGVSSLAKEPPAFVVVTAIPDPFQNNYRFVDPAQVTSLEYEARGSCVLELKKLPGSTVVEDEDVTRRDARKTALAEGNAWVIWMELRWDKPGFIARGGPVSTALSFVRTRYRENRGERGRQEHEANLGSAAVLAYQS